MTAVPPSTGQRTTGQRTTVYRHRVRYLEADQQGVVFNMWFLGYFDEALAAYLTEGGLPYPAMLDQGYDVQLVHTEVDWAAPLRWPDEASVEVTLAESGRTSFTLAFVLRTGGALVASARTVYVVVGTDGSGKRAIPEPLAAALGVAGSGP